MAEEKFLIIGCGILKKEIKWLIRKNLWPIDTIFLDSALHIDFKKLTESLTSTIIKYKDGNIIIFYGYCHPFMEEILGELKEFRTCGQNCIEMLLGNSLFTEELSKGAYFLLEEWAMRWDNIIERTFGKNQKIIQDIFHEDRKYLLCLKTPCSGDFKLEAEEASKKLDLPIYWMDVSLDHLESILQKAIALKTKEVLCQKI